jgi:integrase
LLRDRERTRLIASVASDIRPLTVYTLALWVGLTCRELASIDVRDFSPDGWSPGDAVLCRTVDGRRTDRDDRAIPLPPEVKSILARYLLWRRGLCPHPDRPMKTIIGRDRIRRCASCGDVADFLRAPLFLSQWMRRISPRRLRAEFAEYRDAAGLRKSLHFDCMRATFLHEQQSR